MSKRPLRFSLAQLLQQLHELFEAVLCQTIIFKTTSHVSTFTEEQERPLSPFAHCRRAHKKSRSGLRAVDMVSVLRNQRTTVAAGVQAKLLGLLTEVCVHDTNDGHELQPAGGRQRLKSLKQSGDRWRGTGALWHGAPAWLVGLEAPCKVWMTVGEIKQVPNSAATSNFAVQRHSKQPAPWPERSRTRWRSRGVPAEASH